MESKQWTPSHWTENRRKLTRRRMEKHCYSALKEILGPYNAGLVMAEIANSWAEEKSVQMLKNQGIQTIGECEALRLLKAKY